MVVFSGSHCLVKMLFHFAMDQAVVAEDSTFGLQRGKLPNTLAIDLKRVKIIGPKNVFSRDIKSSGVSDHQGLFFLLIYGNMAGRIAGSVVNLPNNPCPQIYLVPSLDNRVRLEAVTFKMGG